MSALTEEVLAAAFEVSNTLGPGFLEKVYERALLHELRSRGIQAATQVPFVIRYKSIQVGEYFADVVVEDQLLLELKCVDHFAPEHTAQCLNYLQAARLPLCLLINFQNPKLQWKRIILSHLANPAPICVYPRPSAAKFFPLTALPFIYHCKQTVSHA